MNVKFANTEFEYLTALETEQFYNGASRRVLTITANYNAISQDEINAVLTENNLSTITLTNTEGIAIYKTETITVDGIDENGNAIKIQTSQQVLDENGNPIISYYEPITNSYDGYVLKQECGIKRVLVEPETLDHAAVYADRLVIMLGRRTYIEEYLHKTGL